MHYKPGGVDIHSPFFARLKKRILLFFLWGDPIQNLPQNPDSGGCLFSTRKSRSEVPEREDLLGKKIAWGRLGRTGQKRKKGCAKKRWVQVLAWGVELATYGMAISSGHHSLFSVHGPMVHRFPPHSRGFFRSKKAPFVHSHVHLAITGERFTHSLQAREYIHSIHAKSGH